MLTADDPSSGSTNVTRLSRTAVAVIGALAIGEWAEGATVCFLFALAEWLEERAMDRARSAIAAVMKLAPELATLVSGVEVAAGSVGVGARSGMGE